MSTLAPEVTPHQQLTLATLPSAEREARNILRITQPLANDPSWQARFYDELGVVRTGLQLGDKIEDSLVLFKDETVQDSGSYKRRGATYAAMLTEDEVLAGFSTGNHALALAFAGARLEKEVRIALPKDISEAKRARLEQTDAKIFYFDNFTETQQAVGKWATESGVTVIKPFGQPELIAGQCSLGEEIVADLMRLGLAHTSVKIPVAAAGGGHIAGVAIPIWAARQRGDIGPNVRVVGVQPERTDALGRAVQRVHAREEPRGLFNKDALDKDCDALAITEENLSALTLAIAADRRFVQSFHTVGKLALARARRNVSDQLGKEVEPAAALPMAYAMANADGESAFVLPVSGGNVSLETRKLYDDLVIADNVAQFRAQSAACLDRAAPNSRAIARYASTSAERANHVAASPVTRRIVLSAAERKAAALHTNLSK